MKKLPMSITAYKTAYDIFVSPVWFRQYLTIALHNRFGEQTYFKILMENKMYEVFIILLLGELSSNKFVKAYNQ